MIILVILLHVVFFQYLLCLCLVCCVAFPHSYTWSDDDLMMMILHDNEKGWERRAIWEATWWRTRRMLLNCLWWWRGGVGVCCIAVAMQKCSRGRQKFRHHSFKAKKGLFSLSSTYCATAYYCVVDYNADFSLLSLQIITQNKNQQYTEICDKINEPSQGILKIL